MISKIPIEYLYAKLMQKIKYEIIYNPPIKTYEGTGRKPACSLGGATSGKNKFHGAKIISQPH